MSTSVSTGQDKKKILVWVSLCPGTTAGAKIPGQNLLSWDVPGKNELKNFKKRDQTSYFRTSFSCFRASFFVLEHPFLVLEPPFLLCSPFDFYTITLTTAALRLPRYGGACLEDCIK